jgi:hypothetical protein
MYGPGFSVVDINFSALLKLAHFVFASAIASAKSGSRPLGNAPAWRDTTKVSLPAAIGPVLEVAHPTSDNAATSGKARFIHFSKLQKKAIITSYFPCSEAASGRSRPS